MSEERAPYPAGEARPELETVITQVMTFADGSRLRVLVDAPAGTIADVATVKYYKYLWEALGQIEAEAAEPVVQGSEPWRY
jgi:hypothetical protein